MSFFIDLCVRGAPACKPRAREHAMQSEQATCCRPQHTTAKRRNPRCVLLTHLGTVIVILTGTYTGWAMTYTYI